MNVPSNLLYTKEHEWVKIEKDIATIGITDYAQGELGDIVFVELPKVGDKTSYMQPFGTIEAVKAVSELFAPVAGVVTEVNTGLSDRPEAINQDPYGAGWMIKIKLPAGSAASTGLLSGDEYQALIAAK
jgi:glycine cleavage system H protein